MKNHFPHKGAIPLISLYFLISTCCVSASPSFDLCENARYVSKPRAFVLTDISNEPDDQMSLVRFLTHANEIDIQGISAVTSTWLNDSTDEATIRTVINTYGEVLGNLNSNVPSAGTYPSAEDLLEKLNTGHPVYGLAALSLAPSDAAMALINATDASSEPLWVLIWGGAGVLAEALHHVQQTRNSNLTDLFVKKLRVYAISDQDDAGSWLREKFPTLFNIVSIHGFSEYTKATWNGISGETLRFFDRGGPDSSLVTNDWLQEHIRVGKLGAVYPNFTYIMEGDTPSMLNLIPNGLSQPEHPEWGGWGGRYILADASGRSNVFSDAADYAQGINGEQYQSGYASIWRWRKAYQYDFAARMQWSAEGNSTKNNHHPIAIVNGTCGPSALEISYKFGDSIVLDASESWDPDGDDLSFDWFNYREITLRFDGAIPVVSQNVTITSLDTNGSVVNVHPNNNETLHLILTIEDARSMSLTTYRRIILYPSA